MVMVPECLLSNEYHFDYDIRISSFNTLHLMLRKVKEG